MKPQNSNSENKNEGPQTPPEFPYKESEKKESDNDFTREKEKKNDPTSEEQTPGEKQQKKFPHDTNSEGERSSKSGNTEKSNTISNTGGKD